MPTIYTIGHSTRTIEQFLELLIAYNVQLLLDVRTIPKSQRYPHFGEDQLPSYLAGAGVNYMIMSSDVNTRSSS